MAGIGILTCSNATQDLGCSSVGCLANLRKRKSAFADYPLDGPLGGASIIGLSFWISITGCDFLDMLRTRASEKISIQ